MWETITSIVLFVVVVVGLAREMFGKRGPDGRVQ